MKNVEVALTECATGKPISNAPVRVCYSYDSYGAFYVLRTPHELQARTDASGKALLRIATYGYYIQLDVDPNRTGSFGWDMPHFRLDKEVVRKGGVIESFGGAPELRLRIEPVEKKASKNVPPAADSRISR